MSKTEYGRQEPSREEVSSLLRDFLQHNTEVIGEYPRTAVRFNSECILAGGLPMYSTRYAKKRWEPKGTVMLRCYAAADKVSGGFVMGVPSKDFDQMEEDYGDWRWISTKYGGSKDKRLIEEYHPPKVGIIKYLAEKAR